MNGITIHRKLFPVFGKWKCCECRTEYRGGRPLVLTSIPSKLMRTSKGLSWMMCGACAPTVERAREILESKRKR